MKDEEWEELEMPFEFRCVGTLQEGYRIIVNDLKDGCWIFSDERKLVALRRYQDAILDKIKEKTSDLELRLKESGRRLLVASMFETNRTDEIFNERMIMDQLMQQIIVEHREKHPTHEQTCRSCRLIVQYQSK